MFLNCDVLLLANLFENFRNNNSLKNCGLYPSHYFSAPTLCWDGLLNMTKIKLKLISDPDMYLFFEKGMVDDFLIFLIDIVKRKISI